MANTATVPCSAGDVEYAFRIARMLLGNIRDLQQEFRDYRDGWTDADGESEPPGKTEQLRLLLIEIQSRRIEHDKYGRRIYAALETGNLNWLTPFIYSSPWIDCDHAHPVTAFGAIGELADIASEACSRLVFNVDGGGQPRLDIPLANSEQFRTECAACEDAMRAVTVAELARVGALLEIEESRTAVWISRNGSATSDVQPAARRSNLNWLYVKSPPVSDSSGPWHQQELIADTILEIMQWCDITKRKTLRSRNGNSLWLMRTSDNKIACYFRSETEYAKATQRKLSKAAAPKETETHQKRPKRRESIKPRAKSR